MNILYTKCVLFSYANINAITEQIDELIEKKALLSMSDTSPALTQCINVASLTVQKDILNYIKKVVDSILSSFSEAELLLLDYKYFKKRPKEDYVNFDYTSRAYFRRQVKVCEKFADKLEKKQINDKWFEENCLRIEFFKELIKRVKEYEITCYKNKTKKKLPIKLGYKPNKEYCQKNIA